MSEGAAIPSDRGAAEYNPTMFCISLTEKDTQEEGAPVLFWNHCANCWAAKAGLSSSTSLVRLYIGQSDMSGGLRGTDVTLVKEFAQLWA